MSCRGISGDLRLQRPTVDVLDDKSRERHSEYGCDMDGRAVDLRLRGTPLMVQKFRIPRPVLSLRTHAFLRAATPYTTPVRQYLVIVHTKELLGRQRLGTLHLLSQRRPQRTSPHAPELSHPNPERIHLQRRSKRAEKTRPAGRRIQYQKRLILQRINSVHHVVIFIKIELASRFLAVDLLDRGDLGLGIDLKQVISKRFHLHLTNGLGGSHQLPVHIGDADPVRIHNRQPGDPAPHKSLRTPASDPANSEDDRPESPQAPPSHPLPEAVPSCCILPFPSCSLP